MTTFQLSSSQIARANEVAANCLAFEEQQQFPLGIALVRHLYAGDPPDAVIDTLETFQNPDGGFGNGLEVDIQAPHSNPFAARLAMHILLHLRPRPAAPLIDRLATWLNASQHEDGDWHFSPEIYKAPLAPWFQGWTFPALNPACCIAGIGHALGLLTGPTLTRTAALFDEKSSLDEARTGEFYTVLPYVEYFRSIDHPEREDYLDAIAANIITTAEAGKYDDAGHFFDHALAAGPDLVTRIPPDLLSTFADRLLDEPLEDGGWPNPYGDAWRPISSALAVGTIHRLAHGV